MEPKSSKKIIAAAIVLILVVAGGLVAFTQLNKSDLPSSFDMRDSYVVTPVKNQGTYGTCWAFGMSGALESEILLANGGSEMVYISPMYIAEMVYDSIKYDTYLDKDQVVLTSSTSVGYTGGDITLSMYSVASGRAITTEIVAPYHDMEEYGDRNAMTETDPYLVISGIECLDEHTDVELIKKHLLNGEAGAFSYEAAQSLNSVSLSSCDNSTNMDYDYPNHMVTLVGWDDNFPKDRFSIKPNSNGAWLIKNSWGTGGESLGGYQWISYECTLGWVIFYSSVEIQDGSIIMYSYDNGYSINGDLSLRDKASMANVFEANCDQTLTSTSFFAMDNVFNSVGEKYVASVYALDSGFSNPTDGKLLCSVKGTVTTNGLVHVGLGAGAHLNKGQLFSIVIDLEKENGIVVIPLDVTEELDWYMSYSVSHAGESWLNSGNGWEDLSASGDTNIRIKAYAKADVPVKAEIVSDSGKVIGSYSAFEDAVAAYSSGTIVMKTNINAVGALHVDKEMSIDLNGFEITFPATDGYVIEATKPLHMKNGTIALNGVGGIHSYADVDFANVAVKSLSTEKGVAYVALMVEGKDGSKPFVKLIDFYTDDYYDGDDYQSYRFGDVYLLDSKLEISGSFIGPAYAELCTGSIIDTTAFDIIATSCDISYKDVILVNKSELSVPGYVLTEYVNGTYTFGEPVAVDSNGTQYSNLLYALKKGVGTVTLLKDVEHTVYTTDHTLKIADGGNPTTGEVIPTSVTKFDLAGHSVTVHRGPCALGISAKVTLDNSGKQTFIEIDSGQCLCVIAIAFGNLTITGSNINLISAGNVSGVKMMPGTITTDNVLEHEEQLDILDITVTKTYVGDPSCTRSVLGYYYTVTGKSADGKISYAGFCDSYVDTSPQASALMMGEEIYTLTGTASDGAVVVTLNEYYEEGLRISEIMKDGNTEYVIKANIIKTDGNDKPKGSVELSYSDSVLGLTIYGMQNSHDIDSIVWNTAIEKIDAVKKKVGSDLRETIVKLACHYTSKNVPADVVDKLFDRDACILFSVITDGDSYPGIIPAWRVIVEESVGIVTKPTQSLYGKPLYCHVDILNGANSSSAIAKVVGGERAWVISLDADGKPVTFDRDIVKMIIPYKSGVKYYGIIDSVAVPLDVQKVTIDDFEYSEISLNGVYVWESAMD